MVCFFQVGRQGELRVGKGQLLHPGQERPPTHPGGCVVLVVLKDNGMGPAGVLDHGYMERFWGVCVSVFCFGFLFVCLFVFP